MSIVAIETALENHLLSMSSPPDIAWEDVDYTPQVDNPYVRVHHLHNVPRDLSIERDATEYPGIFQLTVMYPAGQGKVAAKLLAERIANHFAPMQILDAGNHKIELSDTPAIASGSADDDGRYMIPISINWQALPA